MKQNLGLKETTILFLEGKEDDKNQFLDLLNDSKCQVICQSNSFNAIQWLKTNATPTVLVIDENIKPLNGIQTWEFIKSELKLNIPILIVKDLSIPSSQDYSRYQELEILDKPYDARIIDKINDMAARQGILGSASNKTYSLDFLKELSDNNPEFISSSVSLFVTSVSEKMEEMQEAISKNNYNSVSSIAHNIKPSFEMIESEGGRDLCNNLAHEAKDDDMYNAVNKLNALFLEIKAQLKTDFQNIKE